MAATSTADGNLGETPNRLAPAAAPKLQFRFAPQESHRKQRMVLPCAIGLVRPGEQLPVRVEIRNDTSAGWSIDHISTSCSCLNARVSTREVPAGESVVVSAELKTGDVSADHSRSLTLALDGEEPRAIQLRFDFFVRDVMTFSESPLVIRADLGEPGESTVEIWNFDSEPWSSLSALCANSGVGAEVQRKELTNSTSTSSHAPIPFERWKLHIYVPGRTEPGEYEERIELVASGPGEIRRELPVTLVVRDPVSLAPGQLFFGKVERGQSASRSIVLRIADPERCPTSAESFTLTTPLESAEATVVKLGDDPRYWQINCRLTVAPDASPGYRESELEIGFTHPSAAMARTVPIKLLVE